MAVIDVKANWQNMRGRLTWDNFEQPVHYTVYFDGLGDPLVRPYLACTATGIPPIGEPYPLESLKVFVTGKSYRIISPKVFDVAVEYGAFFTDSSGNPTADPLNQPADVQWSEEAVNEPVDRDVNGVAITNTAGESYDPPLMETFHDQILTYSRNVSSFNAVTAEGYRNKTNTDIFLGFPAGSVLCRSYTGTKVFTPLGSHWRETLVFAFRTADPMWKRRILNQGFRYYQDGQLVSAKDDEDNLLSEPILLAADGSKLATGASPVFNEHVTKTETAFSGLGVVIT